MLARVALSWQVMATDGGGYLAVLLLRGVGVLMSPWVRALETKVSVKLAIRAARLFQSMGTGFREAILLMAVRSRASRRSRSFSRRRLLAVCAVIAVAHRAVQAS